MLFVFMIAFILTMDKARSSEYDIECMVEAIYHEARSEGFVAQIAVGNVILQRVKDKRYPNTVCGVVHQAKKWKGKLIRNKCQFSYYCDGKSENYKELDALGS